MADLKYSLDIDTRAASTALGALRNQLAGFASAIGAGFAVSGIVQVAARFEDLRLTLQTLYRDTAQGNQIFADIKDFAKTSAFAVEDLVEAVLKLKAAGIEPTVAQLRLFADVSGSVADRLGALRAITDLYARTTAGGLGLEDLNRLADRGIPVFTILSDRIGLNRLEIGKLGQTAEGARLILDALEAGLQDAFGGASLAKAGSLSQAMSNFKDTINNLIDLFARLGVNRELANFINALSNALEDLKGPIAIIAILFRDAFKTLAENIKIVIALSAAFIAVLSIGALTAIIRGLLGIATAFGAISKTKIGIIFGIIASAAAALGFNINGTADRVEDLKEEFKKLDDILKDFGKSPGVEGLQQGKLADGTQDFKKQADALNTSLAKTRAELDNTANAYSRQVQEQQRAFQLQTDTMRLNDEQRLSVETLRQAEEGYLQAIAPLLEQYNILSKSRNDEDQKKLPLIQEALQRITDTYRNSLPDIQQGITLRLNELQIMKEMTYQAELLKAAEERRLTVDQALNDLVLSGTNRVREANERYINSTLTPMQRRLAEIAQEERNLKEETLRRIAAQFTSPDSGEILDPDGYVRAVQQIEAATERNIRMRQEQARREIEYQRSFASGWIDAFRQYRDAAYNSAEQAKNFFNRTVGAMEDLFVNFAKTGKFEWKKFVQTMGEELLRSQLKRLISDIFGDMTTAMDSGEGFFGKLGSILGFGGGSGNQNKGSSPTNPLYVVDIGSVRDFQAQQSQARGGGGGGFFSDLWSGIKDIGNSIGNIFSGGFGTGSDFGNLDFGGFFANGGTIPRGRYGIVGERGPEYVAGPAQVSPMMGTNVTYNINAVDAASFRSMIAADPSFIHAVAMQGGKGLARRY